MEVGYVRYYPEHTGNLSGAIWINLETRAVCACMHTQARHSTEDNRIATMKMGFLARALGFLPRGRVQPAFLAARKSGGSGALSSMGSSLVPGRMSARDHACSMGRALANGPQRCRTAHPLEKKPPCVPHLNLGRFFSHFGRLQK